MRKWNNIRLGFEPQGKLAKQLHENAGVTVGKCGIGEIQKFQDVLPDYQLHVLSKNHFNAIIYSGPEAEKKIYLYHHDEHYDIITSMAAFLARNYFCTKCNKGYDHQEDHKCNNVCHACRKVHELSEDHWIQCETCHRFFRGPECFDLHQQTTVKGNSTCKCIYRCQDCGKTVNKKLDKTHRCGQIYCNTCKEFFQEDHRCYMLPEERHFEQPMSIEEEIIDEVEHAKTFIFFYFECTQDDLIQCDQEYKPDVYGKCQNCLQSSCGTYEHMPIFVWLRNYVQSVLIKKWHVTAVVNGNVSLQVTTRWMNFVNGSFLKRTITLQCFVIISRAMIPILFYNICTNMQ